MNEAKTIDVTTLTPPLNYKVIKTIEDLDLLQDFFDRTSSFCVDFETNVVPTFFYRRIRTMQFGNRDEQYIIDLKEFTGGKLLFDTQGNCKPDECYDALIKVLKPVFESDKWVKVVYNGEFEYVCSKWCLGLRLWGMYDLFLGEKLIYAGEVSYDLKNFWALDDTFKRYTGFQMSKEYQKAFTLEDELTSKHLEYAALDVRLPMALVAKQQERLQKSNLTKVMKIENDAIPAYGDMHINGILLDKNMWMSEIVKIEEEKKKVLKELDTYFLQKLGQKEIPQFDLVKLEEDWRSCTQDKEERVRRRKIFTNARCNVRESTQLFKECEGQAAVNYKSPEQLKQALISCGYKLSDTNDNTLKKLAGDKIIDLIRDFRGLDKLITTYGPYVENIDPNTGRIHARFVQIGAATGRPSCKYPNLYNCPQESNWRSCFRARKGFKLLTIDYSGQELRVLTELSQEPVLVNAFKAGYDPHSIVAEMMFGKEWIEGTEQGCAFVEKKKKCSCKKHKDLRNKVKSINFGIIYGMTEHKLANDLGVKLMAASELMLRYKTAMPISTAYLQKSGDSALNNRISYTMSGRYRKFRDSKNDWKLATEYASEDLFGKLKKGEVRKQIAPSNAVRRKYSGMRAAIQREGSNSVIQGTSNDMLKLAMGSSFDSEGKPYLWHMLDQFGATLQNNVYDELLVEAPEDKADEVFKVVEDCMIRAAQEFVKSIPFEVEGHIDDCWQK